jgi:protein ImuA
METTMKVPQTGGCLCGLVLVRSEALAQPSAACTRWRISSAPGTGVRDHELGHAAWPLELMKAVGGRPDAWKLIWDEEDRVLLPRDAALAAVQPAKVLLPDLR